jgi:hypothetical protein
MVYGPEEWSDQTTKIASKRLTLFFAAVNACHISITNPSQIAFLREFLFMFPGQKLEGIE